MIPAEAAADNAVNVTVEPASTPIWKHLLWGVVALAFLWALSKIPSTLIVFSLAWLIAYLLNPVVDALVDKRLGPIRSCTRGQAVAVVAALLLGALLAAGSMMLPQISEQVERLISLQQSLGDPTELPVLIRKKAEPLLARLPERYREEAMAKASTFIQESASRIGYWASEIVKSLGAFLGQLFSAIFLVCSAFLVSLYMLLNWHGLAGGALEKLPRQYRGEVRSLSLKLNEIFGGYLKATILTSLACMIATFISLFLIGTITGHDFPYKGLVSFVAGISYPIPVIGIIATSILGGVLGFVSEGDVGFGITVLVTINIVNIIIDRTVQPRLMSDAIGVSELFVMFAAFAGGEVAGVWGMLLGIPVAAMGKTLFEWFHLNFLLVDEPVVDVVSSTTTAPAETHFEEPVPASATTTPAVTRTTKLTVTAPPATPQATSGSNPKVLVETPLAPEPTAAPLAKTEVADGPVDSHSPEANVTKKLKKKP